MAASGTRLHRQKSVYDSVSKLLPDGHEKPLKQALYTAAALVLFTLVMTVAICAFLVLQLFIKPLLWAVLCGSFLFPFKHALQNMIAKWLTQTWNRGVPLIVSALILPLTIFDDFSDWLGAQIEGKWKMVSTFLTGLMLLYFLNYVNLLMKLINAATFAINWSCLCIYFLITYTSIYSGFILICLVGYFVSAYFLELHVSSLMSLALWLFAFIYVTGIFQYPIIIALFFLFCMGLVQSGKKSNISTGTETNATDEVTEAGNNSDLADLNSNSSMYFGYLFVIFSIIVTWLHIWILLLMLIPVSFWLCKKAITQFEIMKWVDGLCIKSFGSSLTDFRKKVLLNYKKNKDVIFPSPLPRVWLMLKRGDRLMHSGILSYLPTVSSILIILILFSTGTFISLFILAKVQQETVLVVKVSSNLINETVSQHPEYQSWLPDNETMYKSMDSFVDMVYIQGREWLSQKIQIGMGPNSNNSKVEKQVLKLWDEFYRSSFVERPNTSASVKKSDSRNMSEGSGFFDSLIDLLNMTEVLSWLQDNVSALMSLGETLLVVLQGNFNLIMSIVTTIFTTVLTGGTMVLNFFISLLVFFTALFYLLSSSKGKYKPLEVLGTAFQPITKGGQVETAIANAVNGVFGASIKMFWFYGVYTWVNHCIFGSVLVYIPSILAALFGVIPVLTTYWVSIPSALEIWIIQGSFIRAIGLIVFQFLPTLLVDAAIYGDMSKNGAGVHPYVTGLSVAGGVYSFGLEGAVGGPLILCLLLVAVNLYTKATSSVTQEAESVDSIDTDS